MIKAFQELGDQVLANWTALGHAAESFLEAATRALRESRVLDSIELGQIIECLPH